MKKVFLTMFVAAIAAMSFTSCDNTEDMSDADLKAKILEYAVYTGTDAEGDAATLTFAASSFTLDYDELGEFAHGSWVVSDGALVLTDADGDPTGTGTGVIEKEGKKLTITWGKLIFSFTK